MSRKPLAVFASLFLPVLVAGCQSPSPITLAPGAVPPGRTISVTGTAELLTAPDELVVAVGVESFAPEADAAKAENDRVMKGLLAIARSIEKTENCARTDNFTLAPRFEGPYESRRLTGYDVKNTLTVTLHDTERVETLLSELFKHGANRLDGVTLGSSKIVAQRKEVRTMATSEARAKAEAMAATLGQKLGRPTKIAESADQAWRPVLANAVYDNATRAAVHDTLATGKLPIAASVEVTFELVD